MYGEINAYCEITSLDSGSVYYWQVEATDIYDVSARSVTMTENRYCITGVKFYTDNVGSNCQGNPYRAVIFYVE